MSEPRTAFIFRQKLLRYSETFIPSQARHLVRFLPHYIGITIVNELPLPAAGFTTVVREGAAAKWLSGAFQLTRCAPGLAARLQPLQPALIHAHFEDGGMLCQTLARRLGIPLITTFHGYDATMDDRVRWPNPLLRALHRSRRAPLARAGETFIAVSDFIRGKVIARGYPESRVVTHRIGVDTELFRPAACPARNATILFVGRLVEKKGCALLLQAFEPVSAKYPEAELVVIGHGPLRAILETQARAARLNVRFLGAVDPATVREQMACATMLVVPSITAPSGDSEGLPTVIGEAHAMGVPVVGFQHAGIPEVVVEGETGFLVPEGDISGLRDRMLQVLEDAPLRHSLGRAARAHVEQHFDLRRQTARLELIYESAVERHLSRLAQAPKSRHVYFPIAAH